jgi:PUA domain protein
MFRKFTQEENVSGITLLKSSAQKAVRRQILEQYPMLESYIEEILPKNTPIHIAKCHNQIDLVVVNNQPLFFTIHDGPYIPVLRLLHKYPNMLPKLQVDRGAVKFVMSGAQIMCPGLTSAGGKLDLTVGKGQIVAVTVEGKEHALGVGITAMSAADIEKINSGIAIENIHYLDDGLWKIQTLA